jgi:hypothetical protein
MIVPLLDRDNCPSAFLGTAVLNQSSHSLLLGCSTFRLQLLEAKRIFMANRAAVAEVAFRLRARGRIDGHEVERIIEAGPATGR